MNYAQIKMSRNNLSEDLYDAVRMMITEGRFEPGERLNEVELAASLGVSRTPLREALSSLLSEGALIALPRRGFFVKELTEEEAREIYPIRSLLDPEALRLSGVPPTDRLAQLRTIGTKLRSAKNVKRAIQLDDEWHLGLYAKCPNSELLALIKIYMRRTRRYELASMRETRVLVSSSASKLEIVSHLEAGNLRKACRRLRNSLDGGLDPVLEWLKSRETGVHQS